jgi:hypothetical protein
MRGFDAESVARVPCSLQAENKSIIVIPDGAPRAPIRNPEVIFIEIRGSMRSLSSGRALRGPVGIAPE